MYSLEVIAQKTRSLTPPADICAVMGKVKELLDEPIAAEGYVTWAPITRPAGRRR